MVQNVVLMIDTIRLPENNYSERCDNILLAILCFPMGLSEDFSVRGPKYRSDNKHHKTNIMLLIGQVWGLNEVK